MTSEKVEPVAFLQVTKYGNKLLAFNRQLEVPCYTQNLAPDCETYPLYTQAALQAAMGEK